MAHHFSRRFPRMFKGLQDKSQEVTQKFNYLLVMDFEATCDRHTILSPQEIIEFPCLALSTKDWTVKDSFHRFVKPRVHPTLSDFCIELTGIMQETVDSEPHFPEVFSLFCKWLEKGAYFETPEKSAFVTCGNWDLRVMLPQQCALDGLTVPEYCQQWIDLKQSFCNATWYFPRNLKDMLSHLNLPLKGKLHSGIDDSMNMTKIVQTLALKHKLQFDITSTMKPSSFTSADNNKQDGVK